MESRTRNILWFYVVIPAIFSLFGGILTGNREPEMYFVIWFMGICLTLLMVGTGKRLRRWGKVMGITWLAGSIILAFLSMITAALLLFELGITSPTFFAEILVMLVTISAILFSNRYFLASEESTPNGHEPVFFSGRSIFSWDITS